MGKSKLKKSGSNLDNHLDKVLELKEQLNQVIVGQEDLIDSLLTAFLIDKHVLIEGRPGLGKTLLVFSLSRLINGKFSRIQFTPDLMPSDILGVELPTDEAATEFEFERGPIFGNLVLADELNRANPKTQAALVQCLQEREVTVRGTTYLLPDGNVKDKENKNKDTVFCVMATQNPFEQEGVYPLPENIIDRFSLKTIVSYPSRDHEFSIATTDFEEASRMLDPVMELEDVIEIREAIDKEIYIEEELIINYILNLVIATRSLRDYPKGDLEGFLSKVMGEHDEQVRDGASPRATQCLVAASKVRAFLEGRDYVLPEDVKYVGWDILRHRLILEREAVVGDVTPESIIESIYKLVPTP